MIPSVKRLGCTRTFPGGSVEGVRVLFTATVRRRREELGRRCVMSASKGRWPPECEATFITMLAWHAYICPTRLEERSHRRAIDPHASGIAHTFKAKYDALIFRDPSSWSKELPFVPDPTHMPPHLVVCRPYAKASARYASN